MFTVTVTSQHGANGISVEKTLFGQIWFNLIVMGIQGHCGEDGSEVEKIQVSHNLQ